MDRLEILPGAGPVRVALAGLAIEEKGSLYCCCEQSRGPARAYCSLFLVVAGGGGGGGGGGAAAAAAPSFSSFLFSLFFSGRRPLPHQPKRAAGERAVVARFANTHA